MCYVQDGFIFLFTFISKIDEVYAPNQNFLIFVKFKHSPGNGSAIQIFPVFSGIPCFSWIIGGNWLLKCSCFFRLVYLLPSLLPIGLEGTLQGYKQLIYQTNQVDIKVCSASETVCIPTWREKNGVLVGMFHWVKFAHQYNRVHGLMIWNVVGCDCRETTRPIPNQKSEEAFC